MVRIFPVRSVISSASTSSNAPSTLASPKIPNRFRSKLFDRSVVGGDDCTRAFGPCACYHCSPTPVVVVSTGENICEQYNITMRNVKEFVDGGMLEPLEEETFMIYAQTSPTGHAQFGILASLDIEDCTNNVVKRHELCIPEHETPVTQRVKQYQSLYVDPIMIMYRQSCIIDALIERITVTESPVEITPPTGNQDYKHFLWTVRDKQDTFSIQEAFTTIEALYIADGHHRTAAACKSLQSSPRVNRKAMPLPNSSKYITALLYPDTQLNVLSFNRCIKGLGNGVSPQMFVEEARKHFSVTEIPTFEEVIDIDFAMQHFDPCANGESEFAEEKDEHTILMYLASTWFKMSLRKGELHPHEVVEGSDDSACVADVDAQILVDKLFQPVIKLAYPESERNMIYVDGRRGLDGVKSLVDKGDAVAGFVVRRVSTREIMHIADHHQLLPPKATFFDPKPIPGLIIRLKR